jgi:hypothetical protein
MKALKLGSYGAKRQSWVGGNPRAILAEIRRMSPAADIEQIAEQMLSKTDRADQLAIYVYWVTNNLACVDPAPPISIAARAVIRAEAREEIKSRVAAVKRKLLMLDSVINGRSLGDYIGNDAAAIGGLLAKIGKMAGNRTIREVFSDADLEKMQGAE